MTDDREESDKPTAAPGETDSAGYQTDSGCYQGAEGEVEPAPERNIGRRLVELTEGQEWDEFGLPKQRVATSALEPEGGWMPDEALAATVTGVDGLEAERLHRQVNIRLDRERYVALVSAAAVYGTTPTALARMLINRGAQAILNAHRAEMTALHPLDQEG